SGGDLLALGEHLCSTERSPHLNQVLEEIKRAIAEKQTLREPPRSGTRRGRSDSRQSSGLSCCEEGHPVTTSYRWLLSGPCTLQSISCPAGGRSAESPLPASEIRLPASELLQRSPHRPSRSTPPQLPTRACLLASALICAAQLEGSPPWILGKRKAVCESTSIRAVCRLLSGSKQYV
ncbi:hypothetical protein KUCAC02_015894, partial [Chaenocephalus aceratus]